MVLGGIILGLLAFGLVYYLLWGGGKDVVEGAREIAEAKEEEGLSNKTSSCASGFAKLIGGLILLAIGVTVALAVLGGVLGG